MKTRVNSHMDVEIGMFYDKYYGHGWDGVFNLSSWKNHKKRVSGGVAFHAPTIKKAFKDLAEKLYDAYLCEYHFSRWLKKKNK